MTNESWKDIPGYEGIYQVSNKGRLKSLDRVSCNGKRLRGKLLANSCDSKGYIINILCKNFTRKSFRRHQLVALAFIPNENEISELNHIDGDKTNNAIWNLEWVSHKENVLHAYKTGLMQVPPPETPKAVVKISLQGYCIQEFQSIKIASLKTGICDGDICRCCKGKRKSAGGYKWKYKEKNTYED